MTGQHAPAALLGALGRLLTEVRSVPLDLTTPDAEETRVALAEIRAQLSDYVLPRMVQLDAPLLTVVGGSTGAGKSTLVNSIVGEPVTEAGVLRPTTRSPVLVHHPDEREWFLPDRILPDMPRTAETGNTTYALRLKASTRLPRGLAILDAPDVDSIDADNRALAAQLLSAADLWLFVTSAARYADQVPWDYLRQAAERSTAVAVVLDRTLPESVVEVRGHLARMMTSRGLSDSPLFSVPETKIDQDGLLPASAVGSITTWLHDLASDDEARHMVIMQTLDGAVRHHVLRTHDIADVLDQQVAASEQLVAEAEAVIHTSVRRAVGATTDGSLFAGEVVARWQEFVGTGEILQSVEAKVGRLRSRLVDGVTGKKPRSEGVASGLDEAVRALLTSHADAAAERIARDWSSSDAGRDLLAGHRGLDRASREMAVRAERASRDWQLFAEELVKAGAGEKKLSTRFLAFGSSGVAVVLLVVAIAGPGDEQAARTGRHLLDAIFGPADTSRLVDLVRTDLAARVAEALEIEGRRFRDVLLPPEAIRERQEALRDAARGAEYARHTSFLDEEMS